MIQPWVYPLPLGILLVLVGTILMWRDHRVSGSLLIGLAVAGLYLLTTPAISGALVAGLEKRFGAGPVEELPPADVIVVLGGGVLPAAAPREVPDLTHAADRIWHGARLYRAGKAPRVIVTGARPYVDTGPSAADAARELLVQLDVPQEAIVVRSDSTTTYEDAVAVRGELSGRGGNQTVLLVTSALHMPRALRTFRSMGLQAWPVPTDFQEVTTAVRGQWSWLPDPAAFTRANRAWHEYAGTLYYGIRGWI